MVIGVIFINKISPFSFFIYILKNDSMLVFVIIVAKFLMIPDALIIIIMIFVQLFYDILLDNFFFLLSRSLNSTGKMSKL